MNKRGSGWAVAAVLAVGLVVLGMYTFSRRGSTGPTKIPWTDSGTSVTIGSPILSGPRSIDCKGDTCTLYMVADSTAFPSGGQPVDIVFTAKYDIPAKTKIEVKINQKAGAK